MKRVLCLVMAILMSVTLCACFPFYEYESESDKVNGTNIEVITADKATVYFYPVCPLCDHVSPAYSTNLSEGESHSTVHVCEECSYVYDVTIRR